MVVVKTNPGYAPDAGHPGTGDRGRPELLAPRLRACNFASDDAAFVTGSVLVLDGGYLVR
jgi:hypothetical protein